MSRGQSDNHPNGESNSHAGAGQLEPMAPGRPSTILRKIMISIAILVLSSVLLGTAVFMVAWYRFNGEALAQYLTKDWNRKHRGNLVLGKVEWTPRAVLDLLTGNDHRIVVTDIRIYDSRGQLAVFVPKAVGRGKLWPLIRRGDFDLRELRAKEGLLVIDQYLRPDGPGEDGNPYELGLVGAFERCRTMPEDPEKLTEHRSLMRVDFMKIDKIRFELRLPDVSVTAKDAAVQGSVTSHGRSITEEPEVFFDAKAFVPEGNVSFLGKKLTFRNIDIERAHTLPETPNDLYFKAKSGEVQKARFSGEARLLNLYRGGPRGLDALLSLSNLGPLLSKLSDGKVYGESAELTASASGPFNRIESRVSVSGLHGRYKNFEAKDFNARLSLRDRIIDLEHAGLNALEGSLALQGRMDLRSQLWQGRLNIRNIRPDSLMETKESRHQWGGVLNGEITASGEAPKPIADIQNIRLTYALNKPLPGIGRVLHAGGKLGVRGDEIDLKEMSLEAGYFNLASRGKLHIKDRRLSMAVTASGRALRNVMSSLDLPGVADSAYLSGRLAGSFDDPHFHGNLRTEGVGHRPGSTGRFESSINFSSGTLNARDIRAYAYGGVFFGSAGIGFYRKSYTRLYPHPRIRTNIGFDGLGIQTFIPGSGLRGRLKGGVQVSGPLPQLRGRVWAEMPSLRIRDHEYREGRAEISIDRGDYFLDYAGIRHEKGGRLRAWGSYKKGGAVELAAQLEKIPLSGIPGLSGLAPETISGLIDGRIDISGSQSWPIVSGVVELLNARVRDVFMGRARVEIKPEVNRSLISGELFDHFKVSGNLALKPKPKLNLEIAFNKFPIEKLVPVIKEAANAAGHVSGKLTITLDQTGLKRASAQVDELRITMLRESINPMIPPEELHIHNKEPMLLAFDGDRLRIRNFRITGAAGDFGITGWISENNSNLRLRGILDLRPLELFALEKLDEIKGKLSADVTMRGDPAKPRIRGSLNIRDGSILPSDRQRELEFPSGVLEIEDRGRGWDLLSVAVKKLTITIGDESLLADGRINLSKGKPDRFSLRLKGNISGKALEILAPEYISHAHGITRVDVSVTGTPEEQDIRGTAILGRTEIALRGVRNHIVAESGTVDFDGRRLNIRNLRGQIDEGHVSANGHMALTGMKISDIDLKISAQNIPYREPRVFEVEMGAALRVTGDGEDMTVSGQVDIVDGRYTQQFDVVRRAFLTRRVSEAPAKSWKDSPTFANLSLNLSVSTAGNVYIQNNIADMHLDGSIYVGGTLAKPQLGGQIQVNEGSFRIPFMRGRYAVQKGEVDFNRGDEPYLDLAGETSIRDNTDIEHLITLSLTGFLSEIRIDLTSDTNLPSSQILLLLAAGRTTDALRQDLRGSRDPGPGTGRTGGTLDVYDPMLKQVSGDFLSDLVARPIKDITRLDLFRLELGTSAVQFRMEKRLGRYFRLVGETEFGLMGRQRQEGRLEAQFHDNIYMDLTGRRLIPGEDVFEEEDPLQGRIQLRYRLRFKGGLVRSLGF